MMAGSHYRWLPRVIALAGLITAPSILAVHGCSSARQVENLCAWLADPNNCYQSFFNDIESSCGARGRGSAPAGGFLSRDALDICVLSAGGQVIFDPPLEIGSFPLTTAAFKIINPDGSTCGTGSYSGSDYLFSIGIEPNPADAGADADPETTVTGGTFSTVYGGEGSTFDVNCADGVESHHFDSVEANKCPDVADKLPRAELETNAGGIELVGHVIFRVIYPAPVTGVSEDPEVIEYFDCTVPGAPKPCANGVQDGLESDVDCGGNCTLCEAGSKCNTNADCVSDNCANVGGLFKCGDPIATGAGGGGGAGGGSGGSGGGTGGAGGSGGG